MSAEFLSAVQELVRAHVREVDKLQKRLARCHASRSMLGSINSTIPSRPKRAPPTTPREAVDEGDNASRCNFTSEGESDFSVLEAAFHRQASPQVPEGLRSASASSVTSRRSINWRESFSSKNFSQISSSMLKSAFSMEYLENSDIVTDEVLQRWLVLMCGVLCKRTTEYVVHPGWLAQESEDFSTSVMGSMRMGSSLAVSSFAANRSDSHATPETKISELLAESYKKFCAQQAAIAKGGGGKILSLQPSKTFVRLKTGRAKQHASKFVLHPQSLVRRLWTLLCCFVFMYEAMAITMSPFGVLEGDSAKSLEYCSAVVWSCDIFMNFISGIYIKGVIELRLTVIAKLYARTWLSFDVIVVLCQWCGLLLKAVQDYFNAVIFIRLLRVFRSFRLGRLMYWLRDEFGLSRSTLSRGRLVHVWIMLYFFVHCFACLLYAVGNSDGGWVSRYSDRLQDYDASFAAGHNYMVCLHWALSQLQGNVDIYPGKTTTGNLVFVVISSACSIGALTMFVSITTDTLQDVRFQEQRQLYEERLLREFFRRHNINPEIKNRADYYLKLKKKQQRALDAKDNDEEALLMFPKQLRSQLLTEMWSDWVISHPLFSYLERHVGSLVIKICGNVVQSRTYEPNDDVFTVGELSNFAHIISKGEFLLSEPSAAVGFNSWSLEMSSTASNRSEKEIRKKSTRTTRSVEGTIPPKSHSGYTMLSFFSKKASSGKSLENQSPTRFQRASTTGFVDRSPVRKIPIGQLVSEISWWMPWVHVGDLCSIEHGHCVEINTTELIATLKPYYSPFVLFATYAERFVSAAKFFSRNLLEIELMGFQHIVDAEAEADEKVNSISAGSV